MQTMKTDQAAWMCKLIRVFIVFTCEKVRFLTLQLIFRTEQSFVFLGWKAGSQQHAG